MTDTKFDLGQAVKITVKDNYRPPLIWIEEWHPRLNTWTPTIQLSGNMQLATQLETAAKKILEVIQTQQKKSIEEDHKI